MSFEMTDLPYKMDALEPFISKKTLELHYNKHLLAYLSNLNCLIRGSKYSYLDLETLIKVADGPIYNNAAMVWNHTFYFECLQPGDGNTITGSLEDVIKRDFGSFMFLKSAFTKAVDSFFGVGWIWLILNQNGVLEIMPKTNAGNPLRMGYIPLLSCDIWEHAYYLDYQDRCKDYIEAFWKLINWDMVEKRLNNALKI
jgi:superoxide dismutase, Fe-Mn family